MIDKKSIEDLSLRIDIVELISSFVELRRQGSSYIGLCPFHNDKTPSMSVNANKGFYHCFACKAGGDAYNFVMNYEKLSFVEAVEKIADFFNFTLSYTSKNTDKGYKLSHILPLLNSFYKSNMNEEARSYLLGRGLNNSDIEHFELGFAPKSFNTIRFLENEKIALEDALLVGAIKKEKNSFYASFINRISFPIYDHKGVLVGFGGRALDNRAAKYVNSPKSLLFDKARIFYAFNLAKDEAIKRGYLIICEGYMDAIAFHKMGYKNTVAVLGTALTLAHLPLLKRLDLKIILFFDTDKAGENAAFKSARLLSINKIDGFVASLKEAKDVAELLVENKKSYIKKALKEAKEFGLFYIEKLIKDENIKSPQAKQKALEKIQEYTKNLPKVVANAYKDAVAGLLDIAKEDFDLSFQKGLKPLKSYKDPRVKDLGELALLAFIYNKKDNLYFEYFLSSKVFVYQELLRAIFAKKGVEDANIRLLLNTELKELINTSAFIKAALKLNLRYLYELKNKNLLKAYTLQIFDLLDKNLSNFAKGFEQKGQYFKAMRDVIVDIRAFKDEEEARLYFKKMQGYLA